MATFSNFISFIFLATLLLPLQINARDSQFFSKVTHANNNNNDNNAKETDLPNKEELVNKPEQQPAFIPETENSYGLYGHESSQLPSTTTTTTTTNYQPYKTEFEDTSKYSNNKYYNYNNDAYDAYNTNKYQNEFSNARLTGTGYSNNNNNNNNYYNKNAYEGYQNELSDTKYTEGGYNQNRNQMYFHNNNGANDRYTYNNNAANNRYNAERQGMSDTRFLEGGKYFFNLNSEKYNTNLHGDAYRGVTNGNSYNHYNYHNQGGHHGNYNAYQNQQEFEDELDDSEP